MINHPETEVLSLKTPFLFYFHSPIDSNLGCAPIDLTRTVEMLETGTEVPPVMGGCGGGGSRAI